MLKRPPPTPPSTVALPRWVVGLLVGACAVSVVAVAFLVGRVTARPPAPAAESAETVAPSAASGAPEASQLAPSADVPDAGGTSALGPAPDAPAPAEPAGGGGPDATAVAAYFRQMDEVAAEAKTSQDPQALARTILDQTLSGNMGSIEGLIATQRSLEARLGQIVPPPACREHHQRSVRLFGRAISLLERLRGAMTGQGVSDLGGVAAEGRAIETEARAIDALANDLRRAAGLAPVP